jgi:two-component system phosphate regulon sensor histidine kinase PhoR
VGATDCHIFLWDEGSETFTFGAALWKDGRREPAVAAPREDGFTAAVARQGRTIVINDAQNHPLFATPQAQRWGMHAIAGFPLKRADRVVGVFTMAFLEPHTFTDDELRVLDLLADQAVIAVENARLVERLEAEVAARTAEIVAEKETSDAILNSVGDAIMMFDADLRVRYINPAFTRLTGYTLQEVQGRRADSVGAAAGSERDVRSILETLSAGEVWAGEVAGLRKDGRSYDAALSIAPVHDADGRLVGYVSSHQDISRIKELERARSRFISNVSHQLRTPTTNIKLYARLLRMGRQPAKAEDYVRVLEEQADRLSHLVQDILEITTLDSGQGAIDWGPVPLSVLVTETVEGFLGEAQEAGVRLETGEVERGVVTGDSRRLSQALGELLENGLRFTPRGGAVRVEARTVEQEGHPWAAISVRDTGPGIPTEEQPRIFERFFRGHLADPGHIQGTGLGLSIVEEIMRAHGGQATVESDEGQGSTFTLWLPLAEE